MALKREQVECSVITSIGYQSDILFSIAVYRRFIINKFARAILNKTDMHMHIDSDKRHSTIIINL